MHVSLDETSSKEYQTRHSEVDHYYYLYRDHFETQDRRLWQKFFGGQARERGYFYGYLWTTLNTCLHYRDPEKDFLHYWTSSLWKDVIPKFLINESDWWHYYSGQIKSNLLAEEGWVLYDQGNFIFYRTPPPSILEVTFLRYETFKEFWDDISISLTEYEKLLLLQYTYTEKSLAEIGREVGLEKASIHAQYTRSLIKIRKWITTRPDLVSLYQAYNIGSWLYKGGELCLCPKIK